MAEVVEEGEGFFCPLCKQDLRTFQLLDEHFREEHNESKGNKIKDNIRSFFDKAKALSKPKPRVAHAVEDGASAVAGSNTGIEDSVDLQEPVTNVSGMASYWPPQEFGESTDYTAMFKRHRDAHLSGMVVETNRLVIRIEKLFRNLKASSPKTTRQMKAIEQAVVPWRKDGEEKNCKSCGRKFGPQRRKHHCRLCGGIICKACSEFMTHTELYPVISDCPDYGRLAPRTTVRTRRLQMKSQNLAPGKKLPMRKEDEEEAIDELRMCPACVKLVHRRLIQLEDLEKPMIIALYENMQLTMDEADRIKPMFVEIGESLLAGNTAFTLSQASKKRQELVRLYEAVDAISKRIFSMGGSDPATRQHKLTRGVRTYASNYLQENLVSLPSLPTEAKLREIRERVARETQERKRELELARERQRREEEERAERAAREDRKGIDRLRDFSRDLSNKMSISLIAKSLEERSGLDRIRGFTRDKMSISFKRDSEELEVPTSRKGSNSGWMCSSTIATSVDSNEDPFDLQKQQLLAYIKQAREANRMDEVYALEMSLKEIEATIFEQRNLSYGFSP